MTFPSMEPSHYHGSKLIWANIPWRNFQVENEGNNLIGFSNLYRIIVQNWCCAWHQGASRPPIWTHLRPTEKNSPLSYQPIRGLNSLPVGPIRVQYFLCADCCLPLPDSVAHKYSVAPWSGLLLPLLSATLASPVYLIQYMILFPFLSVLLILWGSIYKH